MTFSYLELIHTCHEAPRDYFNDCRKPLSHEGIEEIHHEERYLLQQQEELVTEFEAAFDELGISLMIFLYDHWKPRMKEVLKEKKSDVREERKRIRQLGIVLEGSNPFEVLDDENDMDCENEAGEHDDGYYDELRNESAGQDSDDEDFHNCEDSAAGL